MKKLMIVIVLIMLAGCAPTDEQIQQAIAKTQAAVATQLPTKTPRPTVTLTPEPNYILETGFCVMRVDPGDSDPVEVSGCGSRTREQIYLSPYNQVTVTFHTMIDEVQWYCAVYTMSGEFVMSNMDRTASGKATCALP